MATLFLPTVIHTASDLRQPILNDQFLKWDAAHNYFVGSAGGGGGGTITWDQIKFVEQNGDDSTGDGSLSSPFKTVTAALNSITDAANTKRYTICVGAGNFNEPTLALKSYVFIVGLNFNSTRLIIASNQVTADSSFNASSRSGLKDLALSGSTGLYLDLTPYASVSAVFDIVNCWINGPVTVLGRTLGADFMQMKNCYLFGNATLSDCQGYLFDTVIAGNLVIDTPNVGHSNFDIMQLEVAGSTTISSTSATTDASLTGCNLAAPVVFTGSQTTIYSDVVSLPPNPGDLTVSGGAVLNLTDGAHALLANHTPVNYASATSDVAANIAGIDTALGSRARRVSVPGSASASGQTGDYAVDATFAYFCIAANTWVRNAVATW